MSGEKVTVTCERCGARRDTAVDMEQWWKPKETRDKKLRKIERDWKKVERKKQKRLAARARKKYIRELKRESRKLKKKRKKK